MTPGEVADRLGGYEDSGPDPDAIVAAAAMLREAERIIRECAVLLTQEGWYVVGTDEWLNVPETLRGSHTWVGNAPEYTDWLEGRP